MLRRLDAVMNANEPDIISHRLCGKYTSLIAACSKPRLNKRLESILTIREDNGWSIVFRVSSATYSHEYESLAEAIRKYDNHGKH
jgi:hypothetical protein